MEFKDGGVININGPILCLIFKISNKYSMIYWNVWHQLWYRQAVPTYRIALK